MNKDQQAKSNFNAGVKTGIEVAIRYMIKNNIIFHPPDGWGGCVKQSVDINSQSSVNDAVAIIQKVNND